MFRDMLLSPPPLQQKVSISSKESGQEYRQFQKSLTCGEEDALTKKTISRQVSRCSTSTTTTAAMSITSFSSNSPKRAAVKTKKQVSFSKRARVRETLSIDEMTDTELDLAWYTTEEYKAINKREKILIKCLKTQDLAEIDLLVAKHGPVESEQMRIQRKVRMKKLSYYVLREQEKQWISNSQDIERLAHASRRVSSMCEMDALNRALLLEKSLQQQQSDDFHKVPSRRSTPTQRPNQHSIPMIEFDNTTSNHRACLRRTTHLSGLPKALCPDRWQSSSTTTRGGAIGSNNKREERLLRLPVRR